MQNNSDGTLDTVVIKFCGGAPYEDIAFRIINKEWDTIEKHGFVSVFDNGVLQLHFNFKRARYRRWLSYYIYLHILIPISLAYWLPPHLKSVEAKLY